MIFMSEMKMLLQNIICFIILGVIRFITVSRLGTMVTAISFQLTHWGRATHICVGKLTIIGSDNGLLPGRRQAIIWTIAGILLIGTLGTNFSEIFIEIRRFSFKKMHLKMSSGKWRPFCVGLNVLTADYHSVITSDFFQCISVILIHNTGDHFSIKIPSYQCKHFNHKDKMVVKPCYL